MAETDGPKSLKLDEYQRRVLGVLMEKAFTSAEYYPMTVNAIVAGCNQKSNRDPVMSLDEDEVWGTLQELKEMGLVTQLMPGAGARVDKFKHRIEDTLNWDRFERAILTELLLRGPQTAGELRSRCTRMAPFQDLQSVMTFLSQLADYDSPLVRALPREPGRSAVRYSHLLYKEKDQDPGSGVSAEQANASLVSITRSVSGLSSADQSNQADREVASGSAAPADSGELAKLRRMIEGMQEEIAELHEDIGGLRKRLDALEG